MDELDKKILQLLYENARMTVKEIASRVALTSPAVSERIRRMERRGIIAGYTVRISPAANEGKINALISVSVAPAEREEFSQILGAHPNIRRCHHVTGMYSHLVVAAFPDVAGLEALLSQLQKLGQTSTQIILSTEEGNGLPL